MSNLLKKGYLRQAHRHHDGTCLYNNHYNDPNLNVYQHKRPFRFYQYNYLFYYHLRS